jgi:hypothetical protein
LKVQMQSTVDVTPELLAEIFCGMDDEAQCKFFVEVGKIAQASPFNFDQQWYFLGGHLRNCDCSTEPAREFIRGLARAMETSEHA